MMKLFVIEGLVRFFSFSDGNMEQHVKGLDESVNEFTVFV